MTQFSKVTDLLSASWLQAQSGKRAFDRGGAYYHANTVSNMAVTDQRLSGKVQGARLYESRLWLEDGAVKFACDCDSGVGGAFCKHLVALGLTYLAHHEDNRPSREAFAGYRSLAALKRYLQTLPHESLVHLLLDQAQENDMLAQQLSVQALRCGYADVAALENLVQRAMRFDQHSGAGRDRARRLQRVAELLEALAHSGSVDTARELAAGVIARAGDADELAEYVARLQRIASGTKQTLGRHAE